MADLAPQHERIDDPTFRRAVALIDAGDVEELVAWLDAHPNLLTQRVRFEEGGYFGEPPLLGFVAENPIRHDGEMSTSVVEVTEALLEAGAAEDVENVSYTLALVASGRVPRENGVQAALIRLLAGFGGDPNAAMTGAIGHGEMQAVETLLDCGADRTLPVAAALGDEAEVRGLLPIASASERHLALAHAAFLGRTEALRTLLDHGEGPNRYNPERAHDHSTPLHQAALAGHLQAVKVLVEHGARLDLRDKLFNGTPLGWAEYAGQAEVAAYLRSVAP
jgi:hypothetical protein